MTMNIKRYVFGVLAGAMVMFAWGAFSHMVLLKGVGFTPLPQEDTVLEKLKTSIREDGLYFFPGTDLRGKVTPEQQAVWEARYHAGPTGILVYHPTGGTPVSPEKLLSQLISHLLAAAIGAYVVSRMGTPYWQRVLAIGLLGVFGWLSISTIYWTWYGFPTSFFLAQGVDQGIGWALAGLAIAKIVLPLTRVSPRDGQVDRQAVG
jgi:hypothetical protein